MKNNPIFLMFFLLGIFSLSILYYSFEKGYELTQKHASLLLEDTQDLEEHIKHTIHNDLDNLKLQQLILLGFFSLCFILMLIYIKKDEQEQKNILNSRDVKLQEQTRLAQLGEMISMIAHQWRQPLSAVSAIALNLSIRLELGAFAQKDKEEFAKDSKHFEDNIEQIMLISKNMSDTIDSFKNYYKTDKESSLLRLDILVVKSLAIIGMTLEESEIRVDEEYDLADAIEVYENEIIQVLLNIFQNARDSFIEKNIENRVITIHTQKNILRISDNAGGIDEEIIKKVFDPYFSTKDEKNGTGLGLYMSKMIIEDHHSGKLSVENTEDGCCFELVFGDIKV